MKMWMRVLYSVAGFLDGLLAVLVTVERLLARAAA